MDSLVANYASSSDEEDEQPGKQQLHSNLKLLSSPFHLPPPKSNPSDTSTQPKPHLTGDNRPESLRPLQSRNPSLFSSLPAPKSLPGFSTHDDERSRFSRSIISDTGKHPSSTSSPNKFSFGDGSSGIDGQGARKPTTASSPSIFSSLPLPRSTNPLSLYHIPSRRIVQIPPPPIDPSVFNHSDSDEEERERGVNLSDLGKISIKKSEERERGVRLSDLLSAPKNSLGIGLGPLGSAAASRISIEKSEAEPTPKQEQEGFTSYDVPSTASNAAGSSSGWAPEYGNYDSQVNYGSYGYIADGSSIPSSAEDAEDPYGGGISDYHTSDNQAVYENYNNYESYSGGYGGNSGDGSVSMPVLEVPSMGRSGGKRGRNETPMEIVEVNQDELMKNRPREDQAKLTGIAFGPSLQPAPSGKGKPSKLHRRKHQIGSLYYDMKQKEMELAERRSRGLLTKAETQAKYGW